MTTIDDAIKQSREREAKAVYGPKDELDTTELDRLCRGEPAWAANRLRVEFREQCRFRDALAEAVHTLREYDVKRFNSADDSDGALQFPAERCLREIERILSGAAEGGGE